MNLTAAARVWPPYLLPGYTRYWHFLGCFEVCPTYLLIEYPQHGAVIRAAGSNLSRSREIGGGCSELRVLAESLGPSR